jgi:hypothetical protein
MSFFAEQVLGIPTIRQWQIRMASIITAGHDAVVIAGCGSGKSAVFQLLGVASDSLVLVICIQGSTLRKPRLVMRTGFALKPVLAKHYGIAFEIGLEHCLAPLNCIASTLQGLLIDNFARSAALSHKS